MEFRTHTGEIVTGERLTAALEAVAQDWIDLAYAVREEDAYASHINQKAKDYFLAEDLKFAESIKTEGPKSFTIWQRVNEKLTGECIAFLP